MKKEVTLTIYQERGVADKLSYLLEGAMEGKGEEQIFDNDMLTAWRNIVKDVKAKINRDDTHLHIVPRIGLM